MITISSASQAASASTASPPIRLAIGWMRLPVSRRVWVRSSLAHRVRARVLARGATDPAQEAAVAENPGVLGEQGAQPDCALRHDEPHQLLAGQGDDQLTGERGMPVVPVGQHQDLGVVPDLEQLLGPPVQRPDHDLARSITPWSVHSRSSSNPALLG